MVSCCQAHLPLVWYPLLKIDLGETTKKQDGGPGKVGEEGKKGRRKETRGGGRGMALVHTSYFLRLAVPTAGRHHGTADSGTGGVS